MVVGRLESGAQRSLLINMMYDWAPVRDPDDWAAPPYEGRIVDLEGGKALVGRGAFARRSPL